MSEMPRAALVNPQYAIPDPSAVSKGLEQSFQVATDAEKLRALKALNDEVEQLREDRINAARLGYQAGAAKSQRTIATEPGETQVDLGRISSQLALQPGALANDLTRQAIDSGQLRFDAKVQPTRLGMAESALGADAAAQPALNRTKVANAISGAVNAEANADMTPREAALRSGELAIKEAEQKFQIQTLPDKQTLEVQRLTDALKNAKTIDEAAMLRTQLQNALLQAQVNENQGRANYYNGIGRQTGQAREQTFQNIGSIENTITRELKKTLPNGMTVQEYQAAKAEQPGLIRRGLQATGMMTGFRPDPEGEQALEFINALEDERSNLLKDHLTNVAPSRGNPKAASGAAQGPASPIASWPAGVGQRGVPGSSQPEAPPTAPVVAAPRPPIATNLADVSYLPPDQQDAYFWATDPANRSDPRAAAILATIPPPPEGEE